MALNKKQGLASRKGIPTSQLGNPLWGYRRASDSVWRSGRVGFKWL